MPQNRWNEVWVGIAPGVTAPSCNRIFVENPEEQNSNDSNDEKRRQEENQEEEEEGEETEEDEKERRREEEMVEEMTYLNKKSREREAVRIKNEGKSRNV